jgi:ATP-dependent DNA helicase RecQ
MSIDHVATRVLEALAGPGATLRDDQRTAVEALSRPGARVVVVQATGWGKSAVYWVATAASRERGDGPTLVVSPLLSLMRDQVAAASRAGLRAAAIHSGNLDSWSEIEAAVAADELDVLLVSPERLANPTFGKRVMSGLAGRLGLLVIDEAHAVSDWGHDFRPDYRRVADVLRELNPRTPVLATTATANERVTEDLAAQLGESALVLRGPLARSSLHLAVLPEMTALQRYAWVVDHLASLPGSGIVYTLTVADAERLTAAIKAAHGDSLPVEAYTGQLEAGQREHLEDALRRNEVKALVATSALGMGYDKPDLGFVVHLGAPASPVSYYQHIGRAGRAIEHAVVALLPAAGDEHIWDYFATATIPRKDQVESLLTALRASDGPMSVPALDAETGIRRTRVELLLKQLAVDGVVERSADGWSATGVQWTFDEEHYKGVIATREREADIMRSYIAGRECLMKLLRTALDDPEAENCGRCSVCLGRLPEPLSADVDAATVERIAAVLRAETITLEPRKMWPGGPFGARGRIPAELGADPGRVIIHADAAEWEDERREDARAGGSEPPSQALRDSTVRVLAAWASTWRRRPSCVIALPTRTASAAVATARVEGLAEHLGEVGNLPVATWNGVPPDTQGLSGAQVAAAWRDALATTGFPDVAGASVLLVVDTTNTTWEPTVAAASLREAGADVVLPLVIHRAVG